MLLEKMENNRKEGYCYWEKMERLQEGMSVSLGKDRKATGSKGSVRKDGKAKRTKAALLE